MSIRKQMNQSGDTIVEVLIAVAVASAILGSAYAIVNRTVRSQQQISEHTDGLKLAESQIELLREQVKSGGETWADFCFKPPNPPTQPKWMPVHPADGTCKVDDRYQPKITKDADKFTVNVSWDGIHGSRDSVDLLYKVY